MTALLARWTEKLAGGPQAGTSDSPPLARAMGMGRQQQLVRLIERIYDGSLVKFELEEVTTGWCKSDSGVRQVCPLSPLLFNIYVRELGNVISNCVHGVKYAVVGKDGVMKWKSQAGLLYADDVCLMANSEKDLKVIMEKVNECVVEYGLKVN